MATHSSSLAWKSPWAVETGGLQSIGSQRVRHDWACAMHNTATHSYQHLTHAWAGLISKALRSPLVLRETRRHFNCTSGGHLNREITNKNTNTWKTWHSADWEKDPYSISWNLRWERQSHRWLKCFSTPHMSVNDCEGTDNIHLGGYGYILVRGWTCK